MKLLKVLDEKIEEWFLVGSLIITVILVSIQVLSRYIFNYSLSWSEELSRYLLIWIAWIGASFAVKKNAHLRVDIIKKFMNNKKQKYLELLILLIWFILPLIMAVEGTKLVIAIQSTGQVGQTINAPIWIMYLIIPIGGVLMCIRLIQQAYYILKSFNTVEE